MANSSDKTKRRLTLQWHLTARCGNKCMHCYLQNSEEYKSEIENELPFNSCLKIIDDFYRTINSWDIGGRINFTGGDPLLKPEIFLLIEYANKKGIRIGILGNPEHIDYQTALKLKAIGVVRYQMSIDGMKAIHDEIRTNGSFDRTLKAIDILNEVGIPSVIMFTLSRRNAGDIISVIKLVAEKKVSIFDFSRLVPIGNGGQFADDLLDPKEYRDLLLIILEEYKKLKENGCKTYFGRKENLWKLLYYELGILPSLSKDKETIFDGCHVGISIITVLADGVVYSCRRLPIKIGKVPEESIKDIFINSLKHNELRRVENMEKCGNCELLQYCRGCPAVAYAVSGSYFAPDPQCWKSLNLCQERR